MGLFAGYLAACGATGALPSKPAVDVSGSPRVTKDGGLVDAPGSTDAGTPDAGIPDVIDLDAGTEHVGSCEDFVKLEFMNDGHPTLPRFADVTTETGLPVMYGKTASWGDVNQDGKPDLFVPGYTTEPDREDQGGDFKGELFLNCGGKFSPLGLGSRTEIRRWEKGQASYIVDVNNDGLVDLLMASELKVDLLINVGNMQFQKENLVTILRQAGIRQSIFTSFVMWDFDADGDLDIYLTRHAHGSTSGSDVGRAVPEASNLFLVQNENGFVDVSSTSGLEEVLGAALTYSAVVVPAIDTSDFFFYVSNDTGDDTAFYCQDNIYTCSQLTFPTTNPSTSMGQDYFRVDSGEAIVVMSQTNRRPAYMLNAQQQLEDVSYILPHQPLDNNWGIRTIDFTSDGFPEIIYANGIGGVTREERESWGGFSIDKTLAIYQTNGEAEVPVFRDVSSTAGPAFDRTMFGDYYSLSTADFDRDGCEDFVVTPIEMAKGPPSFGVIHSSPVKLYRNQCSYDGNWIRISIADDIGASLRARVGERTLHRDLKSSSSVASRSVTNDLHLGLGAETLSEVYVTCSDGRGHLLEGIRVNQYNSFPDLCRR
jgi:hypothetical protein